MFYVSIFMFTISLLEFSLNSYTLLLGSFSILITSVLSLCLVYYLSQFCLGNFLEFCLVLSFATFLCCCCCCCCFIWLPLCVCFYVLCRASTSPGLGRVALCSRCPIGLSGTGLSGAASQVTQGMLSRYTLHVGYVHPLIVVEPY